MRTMRAATLAVMLGIGAPPVLAEGNAITLSLSDASQVRPRNVTAEAVRYGGSEALEVRQTGPYRGFDTDTFAFVPGLDFHDGTIEVDVAGSLLPGAPPDARGSSALPSVSMRRAEALPAKVSTSGQPTAAPTTRFAVTARPSISPIPATISIAYVARRRAGMNPTSTSRPANGLTCGSRCRARPPSSMSGAPHTRR